MADATQTTAADAAVVQQATTGTSPQEFTYTFPDNRVYKAATQAELLEQVGNRYKELYNHAETLKGENKTFRESVAQLATGQQPKSDGFSQEEYLQLWTKDPRLAHQYANQHDPQLNAAVSQLEQIQWQQQAGAFREANPDFAMSTDNINALSKTCDEMYPGQKIITAKQMEAAHLYCQKQKLYGEGTMTQQTKTPPPPPPQGSGVETQGAPDIAKMDQTQLRQYIESLEQK